MSILKIERNFKADPATVYNFVTKSEHLLKWWGPEGVSISDHELDFTKLGSWSSLMINAEGGRFKVTGEVTKIDHPKSVEFTWAWHDENDVRGHNSTVRFEITADGAGGTNFALIHDGLADDESVKNHNMGWTSSIIKLERITQ